MKLMRRLGAPLIAWLIVFSVSVVLSGATELYLGTTDFQHVLDAPEADASARHEHGETDLSEHCHPGMACSLSAIDTQRKDTTLSQRVSDVWPVSVVFVANRFTPVSDPPPPRRAV